MPRLGDVLASKYRLEQLLGSGGMGHVYKATNEDVGRAVAIKVLRTEHATTPSFVDRFLREARAANLVRHPNVVDVLDIGRDGDGTPFLVQELLHGRDLLTYVQEHGNTLSFAEIVAYVLPVVEAVALAHQQGVVHRDIKPENVFLAEVNGVVVPKLLDFGISRISSSIRTTEAGTMMGTPAYMSPEMVQGADADARSDVWALGVMLFELLAGRYPFQERDSPALFVLVVTKDVPLLGEVLPGAHPDLERIIERCLRRDANARYATASELARDLRSVAKGSDIEPTHRHIPAPIAIATSSLAVPELDIPLPVAPRRAPAPPAVDVLDAIDRSNATPALDVRPSSKQPAASSHPPSSGRMPAHYDAMPVQPGARRSAPAMWTPPAPPPATEMTAVVGLGVVGLAGLVTTGVLSTFVRQPQGFPVVALFTKPDPTLNLIVQVALGLVALVLAARLALGGFKSWDGPGGKTMAVSAAVVAGGFLFLAIELARAAF